MHESPLNITGIEVLREVTTRRESLWMYSAIAITRKETLN